MSAIESTRIAGVYTRSVHYQHDSRGHFAEIFRREWIPGAREMIQGNISVSRARALRGMHYHLRQADFWTVVNGSVQAALYDLRQTSATRGNSDMFTLHDAWLYIPPGVAHGFFARSAAVLHYLVDAYYDDGSDEHGIAWDDPALKLDWRVRNPIISLRDQKNPKLADVSPERLPR